MGGGTGSGRAKKEKMGDATLVKKKKRKPGIHERKKA